jgi:hypothetical protein
MARRRPRTIRLYRRGFLNHPGHHSIALYLAELETEHGTLKEIRDRATGAVTRPEQDFADLNAALTIGDCNRQIVLDFNTSSQSDGSAIGNVQHKADTLRKIVNEFCDKVDEGLEQVRRAKFASEE